MGVMTPRRYWTTIAKRRVFPPTSQVSRRNARVDGVKFYPLPRNARAKLARVASVLVEHFAASRDWL
jgi:hypothetical protein